MKKTITSVLCLVLALVMVSVFAACEPTPNPAETPAESQSDTTPDTAGEDTTADDTQADETTAESKPAGDETTDDETSGESGDELDPDTHVIIRTAEDLMEFNRNVNGEGEEEVDYSYMTIVFENDIDMTGYEWTPLDGFWLEGVTFDGQGHTISNLKFVDHDPPAGTPAGEMGSGFIGVNYYENYFENITFENCSVTAYERHVACIIGTNNCGSGTVYFDNVHVKNFKVDGWMDYNNTDRNNGGHPIAFRVSGFIGYNPSGYAEFNDCSAIGLELSGFHNLTGFVGYDAAGNISEQSFSNCKVEDCRFTFSYCLSTSYTIDQPRKFVSVFYCAINWADNVDYVVDLGNSYSNVIYCDYTDNNAEYLAEDFRSWTREEASPDGNP